MTYRNEPRNPNPVLINRTSKSRHEWLRRHLATVISRKRERMQSLRLREAGRSASQLTRAHDCSCVTPHWSSKARGGSLARRDKAGAYGCVAVSHPLRLLGSRHDDWRLDVLRLKSARFRVTSVGPFVFCTAATSHTPLGLSATMVINPLRHTPRSAGRAKMSRPRY